jgi:hypothetical protein
MCSALGTRETNERVEGRYIIQLFVHAPSLIVYLGYCEALGEGVKNPTLF